MAEIKTMKLVSQSITIWQQCWTPQVCINVPFDHKKCLSATVCVAITEEGGTFYIQASIDGATAKYALADACIPVYSVGIASLEVCVTNLDISNGNLNALTLSVKACIGGTIAGIHLQQCWDLYNQTIKFHSFSSADVVEILGLSDDNLRGQPGWADRKFISYSTAELDSTDVCKCEC
jgi:hypothetical protein